MKKSTIPLLKIYEEVSFLQNKKKEKAKNIRIKCIGKKCSSTQGTVFTIKDNHLLANCGDTDNPCDLNIDIYRGNYLYLPTILKQAETDLENVKTTIITLKLEILLPFQMKKLFPKNLKSLKKSIWNWNKLFPI